MRRRREHQPHEGASYYFAPPWRTRGAPAGDTDTPWCLTQAQAFDAYSAPKGQRGRADEKGLHAAFGKVRCPRCGRRVQLMTVDIESGYGDFWPYLPPHKVRKLSVRRKKPKARARGFAPGARGK